MTRRSQIAALLLLLLLRLCLPEGVAAQDDDEEYVEEEETFGPGSYAPEDGDVVEDGGSPFGRRFKSKFRGDEDTGAAHDDELAQEQGDDPEAGDTGDDGDADQLPPLDDEDDAAGLPPLDDDGDDGGQGELTEGGLPPLEEDAADEAPRALQLIATAGFGIGSRAFQRPTFRGLQKLPDTPFAAALVSLRARVWPTRPLSMDVLLAYQTSLGLVIREQPLFGLPQDVNVRSSRLELSVAPTLRLGEGPSAISVAAALGFAMRDFWPVEDQYLTPKYTLAGPMARFELIVPIAGVAELRVGPEVHWMAWVDDRLRDDGVLSTGIAIGGQLSLRAPLSERLAIALDYREARAYASSVGPMFIDVERFVTAGLSGRY